MPLTPAQMKDYIISGGMISMYWSVLATEMVASKRRPFHLAEQSVKLCFSLMGYKYGLKVLLYYPPKVLRLSCCSLFQSDNKLVLASSW